MWPTEKTLTLIELLHSKPALWDARSQDYRNKYRKADALQEIADKLSVEVRDTEKKIKALKIQFRREHLKVLSLIRSGSYVKCAWFGYEPLLFLLQGRDSGGSRKADSASVTDEDDLDPKRRAEIESPHSDEPAKKAFQPIHVSHPSSSQKAVSSEKREEAFDIMKTFIENASKRDEYDVFGENVAHKLRNSGRIRQEVSVAQHKINEVLFNLEMGYFGLGQWFSDLWSRDIPSKDNEGSRPLK